MSVKFLGDWLIIASPHHDENSGAWTVVAEVSRRFEPTEMDIKRRVMTNLLIITAAVGISFAIGVVTKRAWGVSV
jgi:hypothetical protein